MTTNTFKLALTLGGAAIDLTTAGTTNATRKCLRVSTQLDMHAVDRLNFAAQNSAQADDNTLLLFLEDEILSVEGYVAAGGTLMNVANLRGRYGTTPADHASGARGWMYTKGEGVPKDLVEAVKWYRKAAEQGDAFAQNNLGVMYGNGEGVPKDLVEATKWFRKAAEQGLANAQLTLGVRYALGTAGVPTKDFVEAAKWYRKAAEQGDDFAQSLLGSMYAKGEGVPKDEIEALAWFNLAAVTGLGDASTKRDQLERKLGQQATLSAQARSKEILKAIEAAKAQKAAVKP